MATSGGGLVILFSTPAGVDYDLEGGWRREGGNYHTSLSFWTFFFFFSTEAVGMRLVSAAYTHLLLPVPLGRLSPPL